MSHLAKLALLLLACLAFAPTNASAARVSADGVVRAALHCGNPCVIRGNPGGQVELFEAAADAVMKGARRVVVIDGACASACAIFADIARQKVCITERASFQFHKASIMAVTAYADGSRKVQLLSRDDPPQSPDILNWVMAHGGFPTEGLRVMNSKQALAFWRPCTRGERA